MLAHAPTRADGRAAPDPDPDRDGLTDAEFFSVVRLALTLPGRWFVERRESEAGAVSVLLVQDIRGGGGCTFALSRHDAEIRFDLGRGGWVETLGVFRTVEAAIEAVAARATHALRGGAQEMTARAGQQCPAR